MLKSIVVAAALASFATVSAHAAPCRDAKGRFIKCETAKPKPVKCKDAKGRFTKCDTVGAKPVK